MKELCSFGCGKIAIHQFKTTGNYCCSYNPGACDAIKAKNIDTQTGRKHPEHSVFMMGEGNPNFGKRGVETSQYGNRGENAPNWTGGSTYYWSKELKKINKDCCLCHSSYNIEMHHKDSNPSNNARENLIILCKTCHEFWHKYKQIGGTTL